MDKSHDLYTKSSCFWSPGVRSPFEIPEVISAFIKDKTVIDLGHGAGDLSVGFSAYAKKVNGVEFTNKRENLNKNVGLIENLSLYRENYWNAIKDKKDFVIGDVYYVWGYSGCPFPARDGDYLKNLFNLAAHIKKCLPQNGLSDDRIIFTYAKISDASKFPFDIKIPFLASEKPVEKLRRSKAWEDLCVVGLRFHNTFLEKMIL